jgi:putative aldouronate transport system substrate-binding protein
MAGAGVKKNAWLILMALLLVLSACSNGNGSGNGNAGTGNAAENGTADADTSEGSGKEAGQAAAEPEAADPYGKYGDPVSLSIGMGVDPNYKSDKGETPESNAWTQAIKDNFNIDMKFAWVVANDNLNQKINLSIASNDLPDALVVNRTQLTQMAKAGQLADLTDAYEKYASPAMKKIIESTDGASRKMVTYDGEILAIPNVRAENFSMLWIRQDWLDKLGLQPPKTIDELEAVAKAFVERDPDGDGAADTIGMTGPGLNGPLFDDFTGGPGAYNFSPIFSAYNAYPGFWVEGEDGKPVYGSTLPETKTALAKLRDLYEKGLIDKEIGVRKDAVQPIVSEQSGLFFLPWWGGYAPMPDILKNNPNADWQAYALPLDAGGKFNAKLFSPSDSFLVVRKGYEHPEAAIKVNNLILRDEPKLGTTYQPLRNVYAPRNESQYTLQAIRDVIAGTKKPEDFADQLEYKLLNNDLATYMNAKKEPYDDTSIGTFNIDDPAFSRIFSVMVAARNFLDPNVNRVNSLSYAQTKTMEGKWANLKKLEDETFMKIVMGVAPLDSFDQFVSDWKKQGGDEIAAEVAADLQQ